MSAPQEYHLPNDETDLIELLSTLWRGKFVVVLVTLVFLGMGVVYLLATPGKFVGEIVLRGPTGARLAAYAPLNDGIKEHYEEFLEQTGQATEATSQFEVSTSSLERDIVRELQDYGEFALALKTHVNSIAEMSEDTFEDERTRFFSKLSIVPATERNPQGRVSLEWSDEDQLLSILETTLTLADQSLNAEKLEALNGLANNIERRNRAESRELERALLSARETADLERESWLLFLKEQAEIARTLELADNGLAAGGQDSQLTVNMSVAADEDVKDEQQEDELRDELRNVVPKAIYLRGYKSLEKERALLMARTDEQNYILNPYYLELKHKAIVLKNDGAAELFREAIEASPFALGTSIFKVNREAIWVTNTRNAPMILAVAILLGAIFGSTIVVMRNAILRRADRDQGLG